MMTYDDLKQLVECIEDDESRRSVRFGCDCGCGGDSYTDEDWDIMVEDSATAQKVLTEELGVTFDD